MRHEHYEDKRQLKCRAIENVLISCNSASQEGQVAAALMEEVKRSKSTINSPTKTIPRFPNNPNPPRDSSQRSLQLRTMQSNTSLQPTVSMTGLNNTFAQGMVTEQLATRASELMKVQQMQ